MSTKEQGPNQTEKRGGGAPTEAYPSAAEGEAPGQHSGGLGNLQDEPQSTEAAKQRAAERASPKSKRAGDNTPPDPKGGAF